MRFDGLRVFTSLPAEQLEEALQRERVSAVLPVSEVGSGRATVLAATPRKLAVATLRRIAGRHRWVVHWAPWDAVRLAQEVDRYHPSGHPVVDIGGRRFGIVLGGRAGRAAVQDFRRSLRSRRRALATRHVPTAA